jgi:hypothetical protein
MIGLSSRMTRSSMRSSKIASSMAAATIDLKSLPGVSGVMARRQLETVDELATVMRTSLVINVGLGNRVARFHDEDVVLDGEGDNLEACFFGADY